MTAPCQTCGEDLGADDRFCGGCGAARPADAGAPDAGPERDLVATAVRPQAEAGAAGPAYQVGQIVNGHRFNGVAWVPLEQTPTPPPAPPMLPPVPGSQPGTPMPSLGQALARSWKPLAAVGAVLVLGVGGWLTYDHLTFHLHTKGGRVDDAAAALDRAEKQWRAALPPAKYVTLDSHAGCWFELAESGDYDDTIACGGARVVGTGDGQVWWEASAEAETDGGQITIDTDDLSFDSAGAARPSAKLTDAGGHQPDGSLAATPSPGLTRAAAGLVATDYALPEDTSPTGVIHPAAAQDVYLPTGVFHIAEIGELASVRAETHGEVDDSRWASLDQLRGPAQGERFGYVAWTFSPYDGDGMGYGGDPGWPGTTLSLKSAAGVVSDLGRSLDGGEDEGAFVYSAASPGALVLTTDGSQDTIDLAAGTAKANAAEAVYRNAGWLQEIDHEISQSGSQVSTTTDDGVSTWRPVRDLTVNTVALTPYLPSEWASSGHSGWAPANSAWLVVQAYAGDSDVDTADTSDLSIGTASVVDTWTATIGGTSYTARVKPGAYGGDEVVSIQVPATTTKAQLGLTTTEKFDVSDWLSDLETKQSSRYAAQSLSVDFATGLS